MIKQNRDQQQVKPIARITRPFYSAGSTRTVLTPVPIPSAVSSEEYSNEVRYLSHMGTYDIDVDECSQDEVQFWNALFRCAIYVRKSGMRSLVDDTLLAEQLKCHFDMSKIIPMATSRTGSRLLTNGYFLLAYSILTSRKRKSIFLLNYLLNTFCNYDIEENREELEYEIGQKEYRSRILDAFGRQYAQELLRETYGGQITPNRDEGPFGVIVRDRVPEEEKDQEICVSQSGIYKRETTNIIKGKRGRLFI